MFVCQADPQRWILLVFNCQLDTKWNHLGKSLNEAVCRCWPVGMSLGALSRLLTDVRRHSPLWASPFPKLGAMNSVREKKAVKEGPVCLFSPALDCGCGA